jgi:hypothetical protein
LALVQAIARKTLSHDIALDQFQKRLASYGRTPGFSLLKPAQASEWTGVVEDFVSWLRFNNPRCTAFDDLADGNHGSPKPVCKIVFANAGKDS